MKFKCTGQLYLTGAFIGAILLQHSTEFTSAQCCGRVSQNQPRIVGGTTAPRGAYPWMTALIERGQTPKNGQFCGGALIHPQWVLTAGHCVEGTTAARLDVIVGAYDLNESNGSGQRIQVTQIIRHPSYGDVNGNLSNDVALLKLATPVTNVPVIPLVDSAAKFAAGMPCKGMGFGAISEGGATSTVLLHVDLGFFSLADASKVYGALSDAHVAAGVAGGGKDTCQGDSGGPLVVPDGKGGWMHAGVVSYGDGCAQPGIPGIYASTFKYAPWIIQQTGAVSPPPAVDDYGNTVATAFVGSVAATLNGKLETAGDVDVFKFTASSAGTLTGVTSGTTAVSGQWLNSAGTAVASQTGAPNVNLSAPITTAGSYYFVVRGAAAATTGSYALTVNFVPTPVTGSPEIDLLGKNSTPLVDGDAAPTATKGTDFGALNVGGSLGQVFTIVNSGTAALNLGAAQISGAGAAQFKLSVQPATSIAAGRSGMFTITFAPTAAGAHVASVSIPNNDANENPYDFRITGTAKSVSTDDHGNTLASATLVAVPGSRSGVLTAKDVDMFKFTLTTVTTVTLKTTGSIDTYGVLYNGAGSVLTEADDAVDLNFYIRRRLNPGTYFIEVSGFDGTVTGAYNLQLAK